MKIGFHIYGTQLPPAASPAGVASSHAGADVYRLVRNGMGEDFLYVGGGPVEAKSDMGRSSQLIVPWGAASLCMAAPQTEIITRLNAWAFDPAHVARLGANLWELSGRRWSLCLDSDPTFWPDESSGHTTATIAARTQEMLDIVLQHWQGQAEHKGKHLASSGRMVGPRPSSVRPKLWLDASAPTMTGIAADGLCWAYGEKRPANSDYETLLSCAVILGRTAREAKSLANEFHSLSDANCIMGEVADVCTKIVEIVGKSSLDRLAIGLPTLGETECSLMREQLVPMLRAALGKERQAS